MKLLEWNIHKMTNNILVKPFVCDRILKEQADVICLVEYIDDVNIRKALQSDYWLGESIPDSGNQILIAVSKQVAPNGIHLVRNTEEKGCFNFLHIRYCDVNNKSISVIGVRMLSPIDASRQTPPLNAYLSQIDEPFVCMGDFNIKGFRMKHWFPDFNMETKKIDNKKFNNSSIVYVDEKSNIISGYGDVDHILGSGWLEMKSVYKWDFMRDDAIYPKSIEIGTRWEIKPAYPDHAMMIIEITS